MVTPSALTPDARARVEARELMSRAADALYDGDDDNELVKALRLAACVCYDCGRKYGDEHGFPDLCVPADVWAKITPTGHEGGLLCPSCMCKRAYDAGLRDVPGLFRSGPFALEYGATVASLVAEAVAAERERWEDECLDALRSVYPAGRNRAAVVEAIRRIGQTDPARIHDAEARDDGGDGGGDAVSGILQTCPTGWRAALVPLLAPGETVDDLLGCVRSFARMCIPPDGELTHYLSEDDPMIQNARRTVALIDALLAPTHTREPCDRTPTPPSP